MGCLSIGTVMNQHLNYSVHVTLTDVLGKFFPRQKLANQYVYGVSADSRQVMSGYIFVAYVGSNIDSRMFIREAVKNGASVIIYESSISLNDEHIMALNFARKNGVLTFALDNCHKYIGEIAANFYFNPSAQMSVIAVTGTNGKSSCVSIIAQALNFANKNAAMIGTLGWGMLGSLQVNSLTTPDPVRLQYFCAAIRDQGADCLAFEASSHALSQNRLSGMHIDHAIFTNLTQDHLDYHKNMQEYGSAKLSLFVDYNISSAVLNVDDPFAETIISKLKPGVDVIGVAINYRATNYPLCYVKNLVVSIDGVKFTACTPWGQHEIVSSLCGDFQVVNLMLSLVTLVQYGIPFKLACQALNKVTSVAGRAQVFGGKDKPFVIVDYAHTPDALERILQYARSVATGNVTVVFGCGGNRDKDKRAKMGKIAEKYSDEVIITSDNPRDEPVQEITDDILQGVMCKWAVNIEYNRKLAIESAIANAKPNDIVVVAGKGHEKVQVVAGEYLSHCDIEHVNNRLNAWIPKTLNYS